VLPGNPKAGHDRLDDVARPRCAVVHPADHGRTVDSHTHLCREFAQGRLRGGFAGVDAPAREGPLVGMAAQGLGAARQQQSRRVAPLCLLRQAREVCAVTLLGHDDRDGGMAPACRVQHADVESAQSIVQQVLQGGAVNCL
jgi:hypothetical protein